MSDTKEIVNKILGNKDEKPVDYTEKILGPKKEKDLTKEVLGK